MVFEARLLPPGPAVKGIKELTGHLEYSVAGASKEVDLGFNELKANVAGTELGAQITSIKEGWKKDGSQELELKLKISKDLLKAVYLVAGDTKTELNQRGSSSGGNTCTISYESKTVFPAKGRLVADIYDDLKTFHAPFKLENFSLLGVPLDAT